MNPFENPKQEISPERIEAIDEMVEGLAEQEGMGPDEMFSDIATYAPYEGNEDPNPDYLEEVAEKLGISIPEMILYAIKKAEEQFGEIE